MRRSLLALSVAPVLLLPASARSMPIMRSAQVTLTYGVPGLFSETVSLVNSTATVSVDATAGTIDVAASTVSGSGSVPVVSTTAFAAIALRNVDHDAAVFRFGGAADLEPPCPGGAPNLEACADGSGFGGDLGLMGFFDFVVIPGIATYPIPLSMTASGFVDIAAFTLGTAWAAGSQGTPFSHHGSVSTAQSSLSLVSPTMVGVGSVVTVGRLTIEFTDGLGLPSFLTVVPEAGALTLIGVGLVGLLLVAGELGPGRR